jgi:amino acid transporter
VRRPSFTRGFNSAGSVYGFTGAVAGPVFGFVSAWTLMLVYASFAGGIYAVTADEAQPAFGAGGPVPAVTLRTNAKPLATKVQ